MLTLELINVSGLGPHNANIYETRLIIIILIVAEYMPESSPNILIRTEYTFGFPLVSY